MPEGPLSTNLDLSAAKTVVPMIADGHLVRLKLQKLKTENNEKGCVLTFEWTLVDPAPNTDGGTINPGDFGATIFDAIYMYAKPDSKNPTWFVTPIAKRIDGLLGTGDKGNPKGKPERPSIQVTPEGLASLAPDLEGKTIVAKMKVTAAQEDKGYGPRNEIGTIYFPGDLPSA